MLFKNRTDAGERLATRLQELSIQNGIAIGLARGGVAVAATIAKKLYLPLDVIIPRKIGAPFNPELAIGAIAGDSVFLNQDLIDTYHIAPDYVAFEIDKEKKEAARRLALYRQGKPLPNLHQKTIILVDDGIATGATMRASILFMQQARPRRIIIAVPVAPPEIVEKLVAEGLEVVCLYAPLSFSAVGQFYEEFPQVEDFEVMAFLEKVNGHPHPD